MPRWVWLAGSVLAVSAVAAGVLVAGLPHYNLAHIASDKLSASLGRKTQIEALHVRFGRWVTVDLGNLHLANIPQGSRADMITLKHLHAQILLSSLLSGDMQARDVKIDGFSGLFERTPEREPNWRFGKKVSSTPSNPKEPSGKVWFPGLRDATITDSEVIYRSAHGQSYVTGLKAVTLHSTSDSTPLVMDVNGTYNGTPVTLQANMQPIDVLRQAGKPYGTDIHAASGDLSLHLNGTMTDLFDFDGIDAKLDLQTATSRPIMAFAGEADSKITQPVTLSGHFTHKGDVWHLDHTTGSLKESPIRSADVTFTEGATGQPDKVAGSMAFSRLNLNALLGGSSEKPKTSANGIDVPLQVPLKPDPLINVTLAADTVLYNALVFNQAQISLSQMPGRVDVSSMKLNWLGASIQASGHLLAGQKGTRVQATVNVDNGDIDQFRKQAGFSPFPVGGKLNIRVLTHADNIQTLNEASRLANVTAAVGMNTGTISQEVMDIATTDVGALFRQSKGKVGVSCLLGALEMHQGKGVVQPLRIKSDSGSIVGKAEFDLNKKAFELVFASNGAKGMLAMEIPVMVSGSFSSPHVGVAKWSGRGRELLKEADMAALLPPELKSFTAGSACSRGTNAK
ncbi:AsmA family protein [Acetobacter oryzoeni]|uniref:Uncharacterized protein n=1 Tax=Acetobacter oryzoeni TaxID=2500548 RepID=A0A5B9GP92_9PROT|nr:AsmA-like C-terminal region-containing protein [Acetobacter oryzoeni]MCP1203548.1 hypothetical protein [Acetobacter oryzoeni]QEE85455.1 hypothetical protein EOV40_006795 [Acetobacter oryzoeni]